MPRQARLDCPGTLHHTICRGIEKQAIFLDNSDRKNFIERMGNLASKTRTSVYAWALMTNHVHILLRSGPNGLSDFMRKLLTGYAVYYNRKHNRHGYLFQNRYKSIICEEESYLLELVRYVHLNPMRAGLTHTMDELDAYPYSGHSVIMGTNVVKWQDRVYVLKLFGSKEDRAQKEYRRFVEAGMGHERRPELVGGGLIRSRGRWSEVDSLRSRSVAEKTDQRVLGSLDFLEKIVAEAEERQKRMLTGNLALKKVDQTIRLLCKAEGIVISELKSGSRRRPTSRLRKRIAVELVEKYGIPMATIARATGVTTPAISKMLVK